MLCACVCAFQDEVDSTNPVLRDNPQLHEEVKGWLKDQKVQEIFMQGNLFISQVWHMVFTVTSALSHIMSILQWGLWCDNELCPVASRTLFIEWLPCACVQTRLGHPVVHWHHHTPRPLQSKHGRYEWPGNDYLAPSCCLAGTVLWSNQTS